MSRLQEQHVSVPIPHGTLLGILSVPEKARGLVIFVHGSGSSHQSPRNQKVAAMLQQKGLAYLLVDLLTAGELSDERLQDAYRFKISFLTQRLGHILSWVAAQDSLKRYGIGLFGASTGAAVAMDAAALMPGRIQAIVSRGGRVDLALSSGQRLQVPILLLVGSEDKELLLLNQRALASMKRAPAKKLEVIEGASHLFEEPGALEAVALSAAQWFLLHLGFLNHSKAQSSSSATDPEFCADFPC